MYLDGHGVGQNTNQAIQWFKSAAAQGDATAHLMLGVIYFGALPSTPKDIVQAIQWFRSSANLGDGQARDILARFYATGTGVPEDLDMAMRWANSSLDAGFGPARKTIQLIQTISAEKKIASAWKYLTFCFGSWVDGCIAYSFISDWQNVR